MKRCCAVFLTFLFFSICLNSFAQTGCYVASENKIYAPVIDLGLVRVALLSNAMPTTCPPGSTASTLFYAPSSTGSNACSIVVSLTGSALAGGVIRTYTVLNCPIDDYAWVLVVTSASVIFLRIRKKQL